MQAEIGNLSMNSAVNANLINTSTWYDYWPNQVQHYWHGYSSKNTFEQAFKVVSKLIENETIKEVKLKDFIKLVKEVEEILSA